MVSRAQQSLPVLVASIVGFKVCFAIWSFAVIGIPLKASLGLNETQFGLLVATPVLTGSLVRLPLGRLTDRWAGASSLPVDARLRSTDLADRVPVRRSPSSPRPRRWWPTAAT